jgi:hypothetical protein
VAYWNEPGAKAAKNTASDEELRRMKPIEIEQKGVLGEFLFRH